MLCVVSFKDGHLLLLGICLAFEAVGFLYCALCTYGVVVLIGN